MRNLPEYMVIFWAIHLLGAVATLINAWAPPPTLKHCISITDPKVIIVIRSGRIVFPGAYSPNLGLKRI